MFLLVYISFFFFFKITWKNKIIEHPPPFFFLEVIISKNVDFCFNKSAFLKIVNVLGPSGQTKCLLSENHQTSKQKQAWKLVWLASGRAGWSTGHSCPMVTPNCIHFTFHTLLRLLSTGGKCQDQLQSQVIHLMLMASIKAIRNHFFCSFIKAIRNHLFCSFIQAIRYH